LAARSARTGPSSRAISTALRRAAAAGVAEDGTAAAGVAAEGLSAEWMLMAISLGSVAEGTAGNLPEVIFPQSNPGQPVQEV
jgi:hypothetical protein